MLSADEILAQSRNAFNQWKDKWISNAQENGKRYKLDGRSHKELLFRGIGKSCLCIAGGPSFEKKINDIKENLTDATDVICVDKCFGHLLDHGITPKIVFIADAGIDYDKWCKKYIDQTEDIILCSNVTANPLWAKNWKGKVYFYVNKDNIETEKIYSKESGCNEMIPASSNVGNTVIVFTTQILGYDEYFLVGYDYCWKNSDNYYAFHDSDKRYWMKHADIVDINGDFVNTSHNLIFSARWMSDFYNGVLAPNGIKIFNCSRQGILGIPQAKISQRLKDCEKRKINEKEKKIIYSKLMEQKIFTNEKIDDINNKLSRLNVANIVVNHVPREVVEWLN